MTVETSPFSEVFGPKSSRKRVKLSVANIDELADDTVKSLETYHEKLEEARLLSGELGASQAQAGDTRQAETVAITTAVEPIFSKGQSKRIWNELCMSLPHLIHVFQTNELLQTRSSTRPMSSCISWMLVILLEHDVDLLRSISRKRRHTSILCLF